MVTRFRWLASSLGALCCCVLAQAAGAAEPRLLWGDTHVHTAYSFDAFLNNNHSATPEVAYRFARGEPVVHPYHRARMQISAPLDFIAIADHAEFLGVAREVYFNGVQLDDPGPLDRIKGWLTERHIRRLIDGDAGFDAFIELLPHKGDPRLSAKNLWQDTAQPIINSEALEKKTWQSLTRLADENYVPGEFTTFVAWEWSSLPGGANLHRVVMTSASGETASQFQPFGSDDSPYPEDLWAWLDATSKDTGAEFLSIPHNSNISKGFMFPEETLRGDPFTEAYARKRLQYEPVVEVTQIKGDSETHPVFSPTDEFADFETYPFYIQQEPQDYQPHRGDYVRPALKRGLTLEQRLGVNPYQFGLIGSTDSHSGLATAEEANFGGKLARDSTPETKSRADGREQFASGWSMSASGMAAVWAEDNTREAIMAALKRREVYATTGPRIALRVFGGWDYALGDAQATDQSLRARGVPMGSELTAGEGAPRLVIQALKDPNAANLDRVQVVKGWLDEAGASQEQVFNVAWAGERSLDAGGNLSPLPVTVDSRTGRHSDAHGAASLQAVWQDPTFNPAQSAFYYVRVLQIPTARHVYLDALALGKDRPDEGASIIQERAYSSPIWYSPK
ncbi:DUF3604 domain-containing protein [Litorivivens sp.]|uniref:DUF3604 domain-containing protein n=3 Tax=Litorivivens sp. TaxID=2020868 RepID=UPI0035660E13